MYKVLWIDDQPNEEFISEAFESDINVIVATCYNDGVMMLEDRSNHFDAIIIDANCKTSNDEREAPSLDVLRDLIEYIVKLCSTNQFIPWFIFTGGAYEGFSHINLMISRNRPWDDRPYYSKSTDSEVLLENIKKAADKHDETQLKMKYADIWAVCPDQNVLNILSSLEKEDICNASIFNEIRKVLDWIMEYCNKSGVLAITYSGSNLGKCSKALGDLKMKEFVPIHIQRSIHSCVEITNNGSHRLEIDDYVKSGNAQYLLRSTTYELLNILIWCKTLPTTEHEIHSLKERIKEWLTQKEEVLATVDGIVEQDSKNNYHCGNIMLKYQNVMEHLGKRISITQHTDNLDSYTKENYPYFAYKFHVII